MRLIRDLNHERYDPLDRFGIEEHRHCGAQLPRATRHEKGDLSRFIEEAVKWRVLDQTITEARGKFEDMAPDELDALIGEAVAAARQPAA